jgi:hypothetical protein
MSAALFLALALAVQAAPTVRIQKVQAAIPLPGKLVIGTMAEPMSPISVLSAQTGGLLPLLAPAEKLAALQQLAPHSPVAAALVQQPELIAAVFDGSFKAPDLGLEGLNFKDLPHVGRGEFGVVADHINEPGTVIKAVSMAPSIFNAMTDPVQVAEGEEKTALAYAAAGAGPQYYGRSGTWSVREKIYGETMEKLIEQRRFGRRPYKLVLELLDLMAAHGLNSDDLKPKNIMIGRTASDHRRRAYVVDGGNILPAKSAQELFEQETVLFARLDPHVGEIQFTRPFHNFLNDGLDRAVNRDWLSRLKQSFRAFFSVKLAPDFKP